MLVGEAIGLLGELVLAGERGGEQRGIVGSESDHESLIEITFHGMFGRRFTNSRTKIAGNADFDRDLPVGQFLDEIRILAGSKSVADALGVQVESSPDRFRRCGFAGVSRQVQAVIFGVSVSAPEQLWRRLDLVSADPDTSHMAIFVADRE